MTRHRYGRLALIGALVLGGLLASPAFAIDTSLYTYDGFAETVDAFHLVALIFADPRYATLFAIFAVAGIAIGAVIASVRGAAMSLVAFGFQILTGLGLYIGMIATTGTVNIYDEVRNAYQPVGGVPNLLVLVAGTTNLIERAMTTVVDDNTTDPDAKVQFGSGGHAFDLFFNAVSPEGPMTDSFLEATIKDYVRQCYPVARVSPAYGVDDDLLFRTSTDLPSAFAAMAGPSTYATVFTAADKGGTVMTCADSWDHIRSALSQAPLFDAYTRRVCERTGFDVTNATQVTRCKAQLGELGTMMTGTPLTLQALMTDIVLGNSVGDIVFEDSPSTAARVMANRSLISSGLASFSVANQWMPTLRATVFAIMLFMVPIALLFILTPINLRVISFALGLFVFVALWGVVDAGIYQLTLGRAMQALAEMRGNAVAANSWLLAPSAAQKALAIFGTFRTAAAGLSATFVFTVFRFSGTMFSAITGNSNADLGQAASASATMATIEGRASALEAQGAAFGTATRRAQSTSFGDFGERTSFASDRAFGAASAFGHRQAPSAPGQPAFAMGAIDAAQTIGGLAPALGSRDLSDPKVSQAVQRNAATQAIRQFADTDALRDLGERYFGNGESGERSFAAFAQGMVQWKAFGDERAQAMMMDSATRTFERRGYTSGDAALKASGVIAQASSDPTFAKIVANAFDQDQMLRNDLTGAQATAGAMAGRRDAAGAQVASKERRAVAVEQANRFGTASGQREAAEMLGLTVDDMARQTRFVDALTGDARSSAISRLSKSTGRNEAQVEIALERYTAATQLGGADGASREAAREGTNLYGRASEAAGYEFAERAGKLDADRGTGHDETRHLARIEEDRRQANDAGFEAGSRAAGMPAREAAHLDSFIRTLGSTAGNQVDLLDGGAAGIADRGRNERTTAIVDNERLTRMQGLLRAHGVRMDRRDLALAQNGDLGLNLSADAARQLRTAGLINDSQWGAIANGGHARFSFSANNLLVSSTTDFQQSARSDASTSFDAGKHANPDAIEQMLGGGAAGRAQMEHWLKGGFEMDRKGEWRLKPQVADTLERELSAVIAQTGWQRSIARSAEDQTSMGSDINADVSLGTLKPSLNAGRNGPGPISGSAGLRSSDRGISSESARSTLDIVNYEVRSILATAEQKAARSQIPEKVFTQEVSTQLLGDSGLRNRYLEQGDSARGTVTITSPLISVDKSSILSTGRFYLDLSKGPFDGDSTYKTRRTR